MIKGEGEYIILDIINVTMGWFNKITLDVLIIIYWINNYFDYLLDI